jgi:drug/metabolite transporter (DMT)-like permease
LLSITIGTLYQKRFVQPCDVRSANTVQLMAALAITLPLARCETEAMNGMWSWPGPWLGRCWASRLGGSSLFYMMIQRGAAAAVTSLMYLVPPSTAILAWLLVW